MRVVYAPVIKVPISATLLDKMMRATSGYEESVPAAGASCYVMREMRYTLLDARHVMRRCRACFMLQRLRARR